MNFVDSKLVTSAGSEILGQETKNDPNEIVGWYTKAVSRHCWVGRSSAIGYTSPLVAEANEVSNG